MSIDRLISTVARGVAEGWARLSAPYRAHFAVAMDCEVPYWYDLWARGKRDLFTGVVKGPLWVTVEARCRKCYSCQRMRSRMWGARAIAEFNHWPVTAFGTFTLSIENHLTLDNRARRRCWAAGDDFDRLDPQKMFTARVREFGDEVTRWIDRIRHGRDGHTRTRVRYLLVAERHDSDKTDPELRGRPHFHMLLHDMQGGCAIKGSPAAALAAGRQLTECDVASGEWEVRNVLDKKGVWRPHVFVRDEAFIRKNWTLGFTKFQWAEDANSAWYVCKYLSKEMRTRVRASQSYGKPETVRFRNTSLMGSGA